jgi:hypothetical protein
MASKNHRVLSIEQIELSNWMPQILKIASPVAWSEEL